MTIGSFSDASGSQPMAEINTTPLVDVMLVLLVIFIITAPLFHGAVQLDLPRVDSTKLNDQPLVLRVALDKRGQFFVNGVPVSRTELISSLEAAAHAGSHAPELHLRGDRDTRYEQITDVMALAQKAGIAKIAFVTDPSGADRERR